MLKPLVCGPEVPVPGPSGVDPPGPEEPGPPGVDPPRPSGPPGPRPSDLGPSVPDPSVAGFSSLEFPDVGSPEVSSRIKY